MKQHLVEERVRWGDSIGYKREGGLTTGVVIGLMVQNEEVADCHDWCVKIGGTGLENVIWVILRAPRAHLIFLSEVIAETVWRFPQGRGLPAPQMETHLAVPPF